MYRPKRVLRLKTTKMPTSVPEIHTGMGIPRKTPVPRNPNCGPKPVIGNPPVQSIVSPRNAEHAERRHERRQAEPGDHETVEAAGRRTYQESGNDGPEYRELELHFQWRENDAVLQ